MLIMLVMTSVSSRVQAAVFGSGDVPVDLAQLIDDALTEVDRIVGERISEVSPSWLEPLCPRCHACAQRPRRLHGGVRRSTRGVMPSARVLSIIIQTRTVRCMCSGLGWLHLRPLPGF